MRRLTVSVTATVLAMLALLGMKAGAAAKSTGASTVTRGGGTVGNGSAESSAASKGAVGNGTMVVTGPQIVLAHGIVQVRATIAGGHIVDVAALSLPHDNPHSWDDSTAAVRKLRSEVLSKQSAEVNIVSGATYTSRAYINSLQAALDAAGYR